MKWMMWMITLVLCLAVAHAQAPSGHGSDELAPGALGTRDNSPLRTTAASSPVGATSLLQMVLALGLVVLLLRYGLPKLLRWGTKAGLGSKLDGEIRVLETRAITGGSLHLVRVHGKLLLLSSTTQGIQLLADLAESQEATPTTGQNEFDHLLQQSERRATAAVVPDNRAQVQQRLLTAAEQLQRLTGG
jgi:flagellar biogenesis protein FliO